MSPQNPQSASHNTTIKWKEDECTAWSSHCFTIGLSLPCHSSLVDHLEAPQNIQIPELYLDLSNEFSKDKADKIPPRCPGIVSLIFFFQVLQPQEACPLSISETKAMEDIKEDLNQGYIWQSTSPAVAGLFFLGNNYGALWPLLYWAFSTIMVKYGYPLPLVPSTAEQVRRTIFFFCQIRSVKCIQPNLYQRRWWVGKGLSNHHILQC